MVVRLVAGGDVAQDAQRLLGGGRLDDYPLEAAFEGGVRLDVGAVFVEGGGADNLQLAPRQRRLEDVGRVEAPLGRAGPDDGVDLVDEEQRLLRAAQLLEQLLHPLLELAPELRPGHQRGDVEREEALARQRVGHLARDDAQGQPLDDGALAHARLADEHRVVLLAARENLHDAFNLLLASHHGVDFAVAGQLREVDAELFEQRRGVRTFCRCVVGRRSGGVEVGQAEPHLPGLALVGQQLQLDGEPFGRDAIELQHVCRDGGPVGGDGLQRMGRRDVPGRPSGRGAQLVDEGVEELFGRVVLRLRDGEYVVFDAEPHLVQFPLLETGREELAGERPLLAQHLQHEEILQRAGYAGLGRVEGRAGDDAFEPFRDSNLHGCVLLNVASF